jgi:hypothetical protein
MSVKPGAKFSVPVGIHGEHQQDGETALYGTMIRGITFTEHGNDITMNCPEQG